MPIRELEDCADEDRLWGNFMMIQMGATGEAEWFLLAFYGARMLVGEWAEPINAQHQLFPASIAGS